MKDKIELLKKKILEIVDKIQTEWDLLLIDLKNKRITKRVRVFFASLSCLVLLIVGIVLLVNVSNNATDNTGATADTTMDEASDEGEDAKDGEDSTQNGDSSVEDDDVKDDVIDSGNALLAETDDAGEQYINDTLFIGDSNTVRMMNYGITSLDNTIAVVGMGIQSVKTLK